MQFVWRDENGVLRGNVPSDLVLFMLAQDAAYYDDYCVGLGVSRCVRVRIDFVLRDYHGITLYFWKGDKFIKI